ncbi:SDR family oxidoreductase [archaeon]|nr:SDR family oxidoreductase [archaeon]
MRTCLVTGGAGFIGSHLVDSLLREYRVICLDNMASGAERNVAHIDSDNFTFLRHDISLPVTLEEDVDFVFHMASRASPADFPKYPTEILITNSVGTLNALRLAQQKGARFLLASSSEVYGNPKEHPQRETYAGNVSTTGPRSCYDEAKRFAEALTIAAHREHGLDTRIVRIFNTYGPRMRESDGRVISNFVTQALAAKPITVYGDGKQTRSFCYVSDLVAGLQKFMFAGKLSGEVLNLGSDREMTVLQVAETVRSMTGSKSKLVFKPLPGDDPSVRRPDLSKTKSLIGWEPKVELEEGLAKTIEYFKAR